MVVEQLKWNQIYCQDAIKSMKALPDESVDCVLIDPPYNIGIDFGNNRYKSEIDEYVEWCDLWLVQARRVLKESGTIYIYGFSEILAHLSVRMDMDHRWLVWHYTNKTVPSLNFWQRSHESILCAWKNKEKRIFNKEDVREPYTDKFIQGYKGKNRKRPNTKGRFNNKKDTAKEPTVYQVNEKGALPRDVLKQSTLAGGAGMKERIGWCRDCEKAFFGKESKDHKEHDTFKHPTQKPIQLTKRLLKAVAPPENGKVLIPFAGSGSECAVAKALGMEYLAFDLNEEFVIMANEFVNSLNV